MSIGLAGYTTDMNRTRHGQSIADTAPKSTDTANSKESFGEAFQRFCEERQITAQELKEEKDWRDMSDEEWDDMMKDVDKYIDAYKERLRLREELQDEAIQKAVREADPDMRTTAALAAALRVSANGLGTNSDGAADQYTDDSQLEDGAMYDKNWTKNLETDDQTVLRTAKEAQIMERRAMSRLQEIQQTGDTTAGLAQPDVVTEYAFRRKNINEYLFKSK